MIGSASCTSEPPPPQATNRTSVSHPAAEAAATDETAKQSKLTLKPSPPPTPSPVPSLRQQQQQQRPLKQQKLSSRVSPPPPLDRVALVTASAVSSSVLKAEKLDECVLFSTATQPTGPHRGIALAVLNRLMHAQSPGLPRDVPKQQQQQEQEVVAATSPLRSPSEGTAGTGKSDDGDDEKRDSGEGTVSTSAEAALPWWKRILIDVDYRQRLTQLSTEAYRKELKLLQDAPEVISGEAGMEKKKVWRESRWWKDELADDVSPLHYKREDDIASLQHEQEQQLSEEGMEAGRAGVAASAPVPVPAPPMRNEVEETVVMSQYVVLKVPPHSSVTSIFALQHPRAIIQASSLETLRGVALGVMPPVQNAREQEQQEAAIDAHLRMQRRFSRELSLSEKRRLAKDIMSGRQPVPMQTAITAALLEPMVAQPSRQQKPPQQQAVFPRPTSGGRESSPHRDDDSDDNDDDVEDETEFCSDVGASQQEDAFVVPRRVNSRPGTPPHVRCRLPATQQAMIEAQHAVDIAAISIRSTVLNACPMPHFASAAAMAATTTTTTTTTTTSRHDSSRTTREQLSSASETTKAKMHAQQHALRCHEAALACIDGTENLYGLQYVWRLPLPPSGFLRVSPDPRCAMWPDDVEHVTEKGVNGSQLLGGATAKATVTASNNYYRQREMRRLARRVNQRTRKLRWLHGIGHRRVCYNDLELLTNSEASSLSSSVVLSAAEAGRANHHNSSGNSNPGASGGARVSSSWIPKSPSRLSMSVVRQLERRRRGVAAVGAAERRRRLAARVTAARVTAAHRDTAQPIFDGPLNINIYAEVPDRKKLRGMKSVGGSYDNAEHESGAMRTSTLSAPAAAAAAAANTAAPTTRVFLGCYRQSRLLIHYKIYCRALHEEARVRCGPPLTHVSENSCSSRHASVNATSCDEHHHNNNNNSSSSSRFSSSTFFYDKGTSALLRGVPAIPFPVLRLQERPPTLRQPHARATPELSTISEARSWVGLFPFAKVDLTSNPHQAWRLLRESALVQQAIRDIFEDLPHDAEGLVNKRTFILFVLQLLELFFPTHLSSTLHVAIAEEEWVYRGTTEHVGPHTFHEKFFGFPFIFLRDIGAVTEAELVEFWSILRVCLRAQQQELQARARLAENPATAAANMAPEELLASLHFLVPLTSFDPVQLRTLVAHPPPAFDPAVYDRFCLLTEAFSRDPVVRRAPRAQQLAVARTRVEKQLRVLQAQRRLDEQAKAASAPKTTRPLSDPLGTSAGATLRIGVENAVQREREEQQQRAEEEEKRAVIEQSAYYQRRQRHLRERAAVALSGIDCASSSWELHRADVYEPPSRHHGTDRTVSTNDEEAEDVEDALLDYLEDVPPDVFNGRVSLRERYLLHAGYQLRRQAHKLPWLQNRAITTTSEASPLSLSNTINAPDPDREAKARSFLSVMKGEDDTVRERQHVVAAAYDCLLGSTHTKRGEARTTATTTGGMGSRAEAGDGGGNNPVTAMTVSYAAGMYPLRPVPRPISSIITASDQRARAHILDQEEYDVTDASEGRPYLRQMSKRSAHLSSTTRLLRRRMPSRLHAKPAGVSSSLSPTVSILNNAREAHVRRRFPKRTLLADSNHNSPKNNNNSSSTAHATAITTISTSMAAAAAAPITTATTEQQQQLSQLAGSRVSLKRSPSNMKRDKRLFTRAPEQKAFFLPTVTVLTAASSPVSAYSSPSPSRPSSFVASAPRDGPSPPRPIPTVALLDGSSVRHHGILSNSHYTNTSHNNNGTMTSGAVDDEKDGGSSALVTSVLLESSRSFFHGDSERHASDASSSARGPATAVVVVHGPATKSSAGGVEGPQRLRGAATQATLYAGRLRAFQRRQQQYQQQFNVGGKQPPSNTLKQ
ncbi:hypothetical protein N2W54_000966 [Lotmaria passim]